MIATAVVWPFIAAFWLFVLWVLWLIAKSLKSSDLSLKEIARNLQPKVDAQ
jgi:Na+/proline symporter